MADASRALIVVSTAVPGGAVSGETSRLTVSPPEVAEAWAVLVEATLVGVGWVDGEVLTGTPEPGPLVAGAEEDEDGAEEVVEDAGALEELGVENAGPVPWVLTP